MNLWDALGRILGFVPKVVDVVSSIGRAARAGPPVSRDPWGRPHHFTIDDDNKPLPWTYSCQYCKAPRGSAKAAQSCPGPA